MPREVNTSIFAFCNQNEDERNLADKAGDEHSILLCLLSSLLSHAKSVSKKSTEYHWNQLIQKVLLLHFEIEGFAEALGVAYFIASF